jgi:hypothetical protein
MVILAILLSQCHAAVIFGPEEYSAGTKSFYQYTFTAKPGDGKLYVVYDGARGRYSYPSTRRLYFKRMYSVPVFLRNCSVLKMRTRSG